MTLLRTIGEIILKRQLGQLSLNPVDKKPGAPMAVLFPAATLQIQQTTLEFCKSLEEITAIKAAPLVFLPKKINRNVRFAFPHYSYGDLNLLGRPNNKHIDLYRQRIYHTVINLDLQNHPSLHYISHHIMAHHKLAVKPAFPKIYDIVLQPESTSDFSLITSEIVEILKTLKVF